MFLDTIILLVSNDNWPQANLHVTKENKSLKNKERQLIIKVCASFSFRIDKGSRGDVQDFLTCHYNCNTCKYILYIS